MRARRSMTAALAGAVLLISGCGSDDGGLTVSPAGTTSENSAQQGNGGETTDGPTEQTPPPTTTTSAPAVEFAEGDCFRDIDFKEPIACDKGHRREVIAVVDDKKQPSDPLKRNAHRNYVCMEKGSSYVGGPIMASRILATPISTALDPKADERIVCAVQVQKSDDSGSMDVKVSVKNALKGEGFDNYKLCTSERASGDPGKVVSCHDPHVSEAFSGFVVGKADEKYPGKDVVNKRALTQCREKGKGLVKAGRTDIIVSSNSSGPTPWGQGLRITVCFLETKGTKVTKSMKKVGDKPLSSLS